MSAKLLSNRKALMNAVRRITLQAGEIAFDHFDESGYPSPEIKSDGSPVTPADRAVEAYIQKELGDLVPDIAFVGEEAAEAGMVDVDLSTAEYVWFVDPIDGTKQFIKGEPDFTVNIGLTYLGRPVLGAIYAPAHGELYLGYQDNNGEGEAFRWLEESDKEKLIRVRALPKEGLHVVVGGSPKPGGSTAQFLDQHKIAKITRRASSLKSCVVASGKADLYPCFGNTCYWDTVAAQALLEAAGGFMCTIDGTALRYNVNAEKFRNPAFIASSFAWWNLQH